MIRSAQEMLTALRKGLFTGLVLYEGKSMIDGKPIVAIANRITDVSDNTKTGAMVQTWIMRSDVNPVDALKSGEDESVCGDCKHRPANSGACYVKVFQAILPPFLSKCGAPRLLWPAW